MRSLLMIDTFGNLMLGDLDSGARIPVGETLDPASGARTVTGVFSPAGQWTAWSVDDGGLGGVHQLRLHDEETDAWRVLHDGVTAFYLSPSPCGQFLSHLSPGPLGLELAVTDVRSDELQVLERGQPLFWSWSEDSSHVAVHVEGRVRTIRVENGGVTVISHEAGAFAAPVWLPGGAVAYVEGDQLRSYQPDGGIVSLVEAGVVGPFAVDADARRVALVDQERGLLIHDLLTGERVVVTQDTPAAFFWSPTGSHLAVLVGASPSEVRWLVHDGEQERALPPFRPGRMWLTTVMPFFGQYCHSHPVWSPDGCQLVASGLDGDGRTSALVQSIDPPQISEWVPDVDIAWWAGD